MGDLALTIDFGNVISEEINAKVIALYHALRTSPLRHVFDLIPAYSSLTIRYDVVSLLRDHGTGVTAFERMAMMIEKMELPTAEKAGKGQVHRIPVCYEDDLAPDINDLCKHGGITKETAIQLHTERSYRVYMIGFLPGFPYLGKTDDRIAMPRKTVPARHIAAGSVGIAGNQTGIYPVDSPGGWQIIGRAPLKIFDVKGNVSLFEPGDQVEFYSISRNEFEDIQGRRS